MTTWHRWSSTSASNYMAATSQLAQTTLHFWRNATGSITTSKPFSTSTPTHGASRYSVLVTSIDEEEVLTLAQLYRDRADSENPFDELKNQWGWAGFVTRDLARCRLMA